MTTTPQSVDPKLMAEWQDQYNKVRAAYHEVPIGNLQHEPKDMEAVHATVSELRLMVGRLDGHLFHCFHLIDKMLGTNHTAHEPKPREPQTKLTPASLLASLNK